MSAVDVVVVGAGIGGLAAAMTLAGAGERVLVLERSTTPGGKARVLHVDGVAIDAGPTVLTMPERFDALFASVGLRRGDYIRIAKLPILARHLFPGGDVFDLHDDVARNVAEIAAFASQEDADGYVRFMRHAADLFGRTKAPFMDAPRPTLAELIRAPRQALAMSRVDWRRSLWDALGTFFREPRLRQLFARYATYYGSSPFHAPATLGLIAHVEQQGVYAVEGGMAGLAQGMARAVQDLGATLQTNTEVTGMDTSSGRVRSVVTKDGARIPCRAVVWNGVPGQLAEVLSTQRLVARASSETSLSAVTFAMRARVEGLHPVMHNVCFSSDYPREFRELMAEHRVPSDPTVYICAQGDKAADVQSLLVLINAPPESSTSSPVEPESCWMQTCASLQRCGVTLTPLAQTITTPKDFAALFPGSGGALYGAATHSPWQIFRRPNARSHVPGIYLCGGSTHPGAGVPMVAQSGHLAAHAYLDDCRLMSRSRPRAMPGGTSTRTAKTASMR